MLIGLLGMQSLAIFEPVLKGMNGNLAETKGVYAGLAVLEMAKQDAAFRPAYGEWEVSAWVPWEHPYTVTLTRTAYTERPGLDQYTAAVIYNGSLLASFTTLIRPEV